MRTGRKRFVNGSIQEGTYFKASYGNPTVAFRFHVLRGI